MTTSLVRSVMIISCLLIAACSTGKQQPAPTAGNVSDTLEPVEGYTGDKLGIQVEEVSTSSDQQWKIIKLRLPEEFDSTGQVELETPEGEPIEPRREPEIVRDSKGEATGIRVFQSRDSRWQFRLRLIDEAEE